MSAGLIFVLAGIAGIILGILGLGIESALYRRRQKRIMNEMEGE